MSNMIKEEFAQRRMYRVVGVAFHNEHVLLHRSARDDFWSLPGGGCEFTETSIEAIQREMREEMGIEVEVKRLLWVVENIFQVGGAKQHELEFIFLIDFPAYPGWYDKSRSFSGIEGRLALEFRWFHVEELKKLTVLPAFLKDALQHLPETVEHVISRTI